MSETDLLSGHTDDVCNVIIVPPGGIHQQATVGPGTSVSSRLESRDLSNRSHHWYYGDDGAIEASTTSLAAKADQW